MFSNSSASFETRVKPRSEDGFTLIELLVVILIIGILAAIAIPTFLNQRTKGQDACAKSQVRTMATAMETYFTDNNTYSGVTMDALNAIESAVTGAGACGNGTTAVAGQTVAGVCAVGNTSRDSYCVSETSVAQTNGTPHEFLIQKVVGQTYRLCTPAGEGACPASGTW